MKTISVFVHMYFCLVVTCTVRGISMLPGLAREEWKSPWRCSLLKKKEKKTSLGHVHAYAFSVRYLSVSLFIRNTRCSVLYFFIAYFQQNSFGAM